MKLKIVTEKLHQFRLINFVELGYIYKELKNKVHLGQKADIIN